MRNGRGMCGVRCAVGVWNLHDSGESDPHILLVEAKGSPHERTQNIPGLGNRDENLNASRRILFRG